MGCSKGYKKQGDTVYYMKWNESSGQIKRQIEADAKTLQIFNDYYAKDDYSVFFRGEKISNVDPKTFQALSQDYAKDKDHVIYRDGNIIETADVETFTLLPKQQYYAKDHKQVYNDDQVIQGADVNTFKVISEKVAKDKNNFYRYQYRIPVEDYASFEQIKNDYWKDKYHVYDLSKLYDLYHNPHSTKSIIVEGIDAKTAKPVFRKNYIQDKNGYHYR
ncbi:DKNYY domain-containing protein [Myroides sp. LJL116]